VANWLENAKRTADAQPDKGVFVVPEKTKVRWQQAASKMSLMVVRRYLQQVCTLSGVHVCVHTTYVS
jgi:hypothetical protein